MTDDRIPPTQSGALPPTPPAPAGVVYGVPAPRPPLIPSRTLYVLLAAAGGVLLLSFLMAVGGAPAEVHLTVAFVGVVFLVIVLILGAAGATDVPQEARVIMAAAAVLLVLASMWGFTTATRASYATCGAIVAAPALFAIRAFTMLRDGWLARRAAAAAA